MKLTEFIKENCPHVKIKDFNYILEKKSFAAADKLSQKHPDWVFMRILPDHYDLLYMGSRRAFSKKKYDCPDQFIEIKQFIGGHDGRQDDSDFDMQSFIRETCPDKTVIDITEKITQSYWLKIMGDAMLDLSTIYFMKRTDRTDPFFFMAHIPGDFYVLHGDDFIHTNRFNLGDGFKRLLKKTVYKQLDEDCMVCKVDLGKNWDIPKDKCYQCSCDLCKECLGNLARSQNDHRDKSFFDNESIIFMDCPVCRADKAFGCSFVPKQK